MKVLSRYELELAAPDGDRKLVINTSFYRRSVDPGYGQLIKTMLNQGLFDNYILILVQALLSSGMVLDGV